MLHEIDISFLDKQEITQKLFPLSTEINTSGGTSLSLSQDFSGDAYFLEVDENVRICCKFFVEDKRYPTILYFHGNRETALDQGSFAAKYLSRKINLFVTDYRGYGVSDGMPNMTNLFHDCHQIYEGFKKIIKENKYSPRIFVMGRSLGSLPAIELAYRYPREFKGLIVESGSAQNFNSLWSGADTADIQKLAEAKFYNKDKIREVTLPTLIIHGEQDNMIPVQIGKALYNLSGAKDKELVVIPGAGHDDLIDKEKAQYLSAIEQFVNKHKARVNRSTKKPATS